MNELHRFIIEASRAAILLLAGILPSSSVQGSTVLPRIRTELAPTGKLRAAINFGNPVLAQKDPITGEPRGVSADLAKELGRRLGVHVDFITFDAAGKVFDAPKEGWG